MAKKRWLTKEEKRLLKPHAEHYSEMYRFISTASTEDLERLNNSCRSCAQDNCAWTEYDAAQYLMREIEREIGCRNRRDAELSESIEPINAILGRLADDGGISL